MSVIAQIEKGVDTLGTWADKVNALVESQSNGIISIYHADGTGVTVSSWDDLNDESGNVQNDDLVIVGKGDYGATMLTQSASGKVISKTGLTIIGVGSPMVYGSTSGTSVTTGNVLVEFLNADNLLVDGIHFQCVSEASYSSASGVYAVRNTGTDGGHQTTGTVMRNCKFAYINESAAPVGPETYVHIHADESNIIEDCEFITLNPAGISTISHMSLHDAGELNVIGCTFVGNADTRFDVSYEPVSVRDSYGFGQGSKLLTKMISFNEALAHVSAPYKQYLLSTDEAFDWVYCDSAYISDTGFDGGQHDRGYLHDAISTDGTQYILHGKPANRTANLIIEQPIYWETADVGDIDYECRLDANTRGTASSWSVTTGVLALAAPGAAGFAAITHTLSVSNSVDDDKHVLLFKFQRTVVAVDAYAGNIWSRPIRYRWEY